MTYKKRREAVQRALSGEADIVLGARSALLLPFSNLKLIVVDEEHDHSYKQQERGTYNARDLSILRAQLLNIPIILGSATPSLESYARAVEKKSTLFKLKKYFETPEPTIEVVDLKKEWTNEAKSFISTRLHSAISEQLEKKEQVLLFLNRRGSASQRLCLGCGSVDECKNCSMTMTIHSDTHSAICHWCGYQYRLKECSVCGSKKFFLGGIGTKEVEAQVQARFPDAKVARLDRDEVLKKDSLARTLKDFADGKINILVGTQMISKGIDIPKLSLVGVVLADQGWGIPDFRATERAYQLMKQLLGRAGRRGQRAHFVIQTFQTEHPVFNHIYDQAFEKFAESELATRKAVDLPPYSKITLLTLSHRDEALLQSEAQRYVRRLKVWGESLGITVVGPVAAPISRWKGQFRLQILAKASPRAATTSFVNAILDDFEKNPFNFKLKVDRDPYQFM